MTTESSGGAGSQTGNEGGGNNFWSLLPSFDPASDNVKEYIDKVKFLEKVVPTKDKSMLAPRLALLCRGTAWAQVRAMDASQLNDPNTGVKHFLAALAGWEESAEMKTFDLFERAIYKTTQRSDESTMSYVNRLQVSFAELGDVSVKQFQAFLLLRQSALGVEDKKRILTMTQGQMDTGEIERAMRTLSTMVLSSNSDPKKKVYPTNYVEPEPGDFGEQDATPASTYLATYEDEELDTETFEVLVSQGDEHALQIQAFEQDLSDMFQEVPDLQQALISYQEARSKLTEKRKFRGFWPTKGKSKSAGKGFASGYRKGSSKGYGKADLLAKIARTNCKICGEKGHWKAECPRNNEKGTKDSVNLVSHMPSFVVASPIIENNTDHVIVEDLPEDFEEEFEKCETQVGSFVQPKSKDFIMINKRGKSSIIDNIDVRLPRHPKFQCQDIFVAVHRCPEETSLSIREKVCKFWADRFATRNPPIPDDPSMEVIAATSGHPKKGGPLCKVDQFQGCAILDTGASRSVIGDDVLPSLLKSLPQDVRKLTYETPSKVGFRFGNNQITHSFKQVRIPILRPRQRIWLVIEVVPNATPFLLSIQTMKTLGAQIDLSTNECYLSKLNRSLSLRESSNGLYLIDMKELCIESSVCHHAGHFSAKKEPSNLVFPPPGLESVRFPRHADTTGNHGSDSYHSGSCDGVSQVPVCDPHELGGDTHRRPRPGNLNGCSQQDQYAASRGAVPEGSDRRDCKSFATPKFRNNNEGITTSGSSCSDANGSVGGRGGLGARVFGSHSRRIIGTGWSPISCGNVPESTSTSPAHDKPGDASHSANSACDNTSTETSGNKKELTNCESGDTSSYGQSFNGQCSDPSQQPTGFDITSSGALGKQEGVLGKEACWQPIRGGVRDRSRLSDLGERKSQFGKCGDVRFHHLHPSPSVSRSTSNATEPIVSNPIYMAMLNQVVKDSLEYKWLFSCKREQTVPHRLDLLEVYASDSSRLTSEIIRQGGRAKRFTVSNGDLSTFEGQCELLKWIIRYRPKHIWLAPECAPWCQWNKFNCQRSVPLWNKIHRSREESRKQLRFCTFVMKLQLSLNGHFHLENPVLSGMWEQPEMTSVCENTLSARFHQCRFFLRHPETQELIKKGTRVQTSSIAMFEELNKMKCDGQHTHANLEGHCRFQGKGINVTRYAAFYPTAMAKHISKTILQANHEYGCNLTIADESNITLSTLFHLGELDVEPGSKRAKLDKPRERKREKPQEIEGEGEPESKKQKEGVEDKPDEQQEEIEDPKWKQLFDRLQTELPKSGVVRWDDRNNEVLKEIRELCPELEIQSVLAGKGRERYISHPEALPYRRTVILTRFNRKIVNLGTEEIEGLSKNSIQRKARASHIMVCIFGRPMSQVSEQKGEEVEELQVSPKREAPRVAETATIDPSPWTAAAVSQSGPAFKGLSSSDQSMIKKLHINLGHPTSERLAAHLKYRGARDEIVEGAKEYLCSSCVERRPPALNPPGNLKEKVSFNDRVWMDGFEWKSASGSKYYVLHLIDEASHFHLGKRTVRDSRLAQKVVEESWMSWAGSPHELILDCGGEFVSSQWKDFLQREGIKTVLTAAPWQRGKIERHGGIVKEMLSRIDHDQPIHNEAEFDRALNQCFRAKNSLVSVNGFSPEQAVLGKATRLPASIASDEDMPSHLLAAGDSHESMKFQQALRLRNLAQKAFFDSDSSQALRRAFLRKSRGMNTEWQSGQPCMFWDKRKSPNMIEKGRWCGPAQVVLVESKSIVWITHMNRLLRCARDNLRPVSLREFSSHQRFAQQVSEERLAELSKNLQQNLRERSGMFQFSDLSTVNPEEHTAEEEQLGLGPQPETEPNSSTPSEPGGNNLPMAHNVPIPDLGDDDLETPNSQQYTPTTPSNGEIFGENVGNSNPTGEPIDLDGDEDQANPESANVNFQHALITEQVESGEYIHSDEDTLWSEPVDPAFDVCSFEFCLPSQQVESWIQNPDRDCAFLVSAARKASSEVQFSKLDQKEKEAFQRAKEKELMCWLDTSTVKRILRTRIHPDRIMSSRWILTYKPDPNSEVGYKHKARLVVKGFQDPEIDSVATDSPTLTRDGRMVLMQVVSSMNWQIQSFDITTAFLRGKGDGRQLAMDPVPELRQLMQLKGDEVCLLEGNAYGRVDAPLLFYKEFRHQLEKVGFEAHPLDGCLYMLRNSETGRLDGILGTHVDDGIGGGNQNFESAIKQVSKVLPFGSHDRLKFRFTGLDIEQLPDFTIRVHQGEYIHKIPPIDVPKNRRSDRDSVGN